MFALLRSWFVTIAHKLGFLNKTATLVLLGLDNAGKTTLQYKLKTGNVQNFVPTQRAKEEALSIGGLSIRAWDLGGHAAARHLWHKYSVAADGIIFMIDASDHERIQEACDELHRLLEDKSLYHLPVLILANKVDVQGSLSHAQLSSGLALDRLGHYNLQLFLVSVIHGTGYIEAFNWLASQIP